MYSDASDMGYGSYIVEHGSHLAQGLWSLEESKESSTWRELRAVALILESVACKLRYLRVRWISSNQNVVRIIQVGSRKEKLQKRP